MIVCPNCDHHNPDGATQCEACYTPLPEMVPCVNCGAPVQVDANFCGQCGFNLQSPEAAFPTAMEAPVAPPFEEDGGSDFEVEGPLLLGEPDGEQPSKSLVEAAAAANMALAEPVPAGLVNAIPPDLDSEPDFEADLEAALEASVASSAVSIPMASHAPTQLQGQRAKLLHVRSNVAIELPDALTVIHIGKANDRIPPDIDVSGFPDSEIVSRVHADIRVEGDIYYIEDLGSSNGTFVNNLPLAPGNRHRLRMGDRISLGKGDLMTFLFQVT